MSKTITVNFPSDDRMYLNSPLVQNRFASRLFGLVVCAEEDVCGFEYSADLKFFFAFVEVNKTLLVWVFALCDTCDVDS